MKKANICLWWRWLSFVEFYFIVENKEITFQCLYNEDIFVNHVHVLQFSNSSKYKNPMPIMSAP